MSQRYDVWYTNYKGESSRRIFAGYEMSYTSNEWHPEPQWLIKGFDLKKKEWRYFAVKDMVPYDNQDGERHED